MGSSSRYPRKTYKDISYQRKNKNYNLKDASDKKNLPHKQDLPGPQKKDLRKKDLPHKNDLPYKNDKNDLPHKRPAPKTVRSCKKAPPKKDHRCGWAGCPSSFSRRSDLTRHILTHTQERPFKCTYGHCTKRFNQRGQLTTHLNTHTGNKPHLCVICDRRFGDPASLTRHRSEVHGGKKKFECKLCNFSNSRKGQFSKHMLEHHGVGDADVEALYPPSKRTRKGKRVVRRSPTPVKDELVDELDEMDEESPDRPDDGSVGEAPSECGSACGGPGMMYPPPWYIPQPGGGYPYHYPMHPYRYPYSSENTTPSSLAGPSSEPYGPQYPLHPSAPQYPWYDYDPYGRPDPSMHGGEYRSHAVYPCCAGCQDGATSSSSNSYDPYRQALPPTRPPY